METLPVIIVKLCWVHHRIIMHSIFFCPLFNYIYVMQYYATDNTQQSDCDSDISSHRCVASMAWHTQSCQKFDVNIFNELQHSEIKYYITQGLWLGCKDVNWIHLSQGRVQWQTLVNTVMKLTGSIKDKEILKQLSDHQLLRKDSR